MRSTDIKRMLEHIDKDLASLENEYTSSLRAKELPASLAIDVKNLMENLRSCLDYMAQDIYEIVIEPHRSKAGLKPLKKAYFPYGKTKADFDGAVTKNLPDLSSLSPNVYGILESIQPFNAGITWLVDLCSTVNTNKHDSLSPQERSERKAYTVGSKDGSASISAPAGAIEAPPGAIHIGSGAVVFDPDTGVPLQTPGLDVKVTTWVDFKFADTDISVLPLLKSAREAIEKAYDELYKELT